MKSLKEAAAAAADHSSSISERSQEDSSALKSKLDSSESARATLSERCSSLEESLELMRSEFENMEDYWQVRGYLGGGN